MHTVREFVDAGGLISYGSIWPSQFRRAADFVDKILRGAKPADLPVDRLIRHACQPLRVSVAFKCDLEARLRSYL